MATADGAEADIPSDEEFLVLFEQLRQDGYRLVPYQLEATLAILRLARSERATADRLVYLLTPILATSPEEQADLQNRLSRWRGPVVVGQIEPVETEIPSIPSVARRGRAWPVVAAAAGVLALALLIVYALNQPDIPLPIPPERLGPTTAAGPDEPQATTQTITTVFYMTSPFYGVVQWGLILAPLVALGGWFALRWHWRRQWLARGRSEGELDILDLGHRTAGAALFASPELSVTAQQWRRFRRVPIRDLDLERTVTATVERAGLFTPVFRVRPVSPEYVILIEEESRHDHLARLADIVVDRLVAEGVSIERFYYAGGLHHLRTAQAAGTARALTEFEAEASHRSLIIMGDGADLFHPLSSQLDPRTAEALAAWQYRAFLSTRPISSWSNRELALLDSGMALATVSRKGLQTFGEYVANGHPDHARLLEGVLVDRGTLRPDAAAPPQLSVAHLVDALRALIQVALRGNLPARARDYLVEALRLSDRLNNLLAALDSIARARDMSGTALLLDAPRLIEAIRNWVQVKEATESSPYPIEHDARLSFRDTIASSTRTKVFIIYSHADKEWLERLKRYLKPLVREGHLDCWDDTHIRPGDNWQQEIRTALEMAQVAVLLISANFFASDFINENELLPLLLAAAQAKGVRILPVIISASRFARHPDLARFQAVNLPDWPLAKMSPAEQEKVFDHLAQTIERALNFQASPGTAPGRPSDVSAQQADNRRRMLELVRKTWVDGYLKNSLHNLVRIELRLAEKADLVSRPWDLIVQQPDRAPRSLPYGQTITAIFDELAQALLILGAPGAGKTTLLLELARDLLDRAEQETNHPIPVVFHLASWAVRRRPLADWLVDELVERYYVPRKIAQTWTEADQILPLLDGLDEVAPEHRAACVKAINTFRFQGQHGLVPLAVCCREADYQALPTRVDLVGAVVIQPLSRVQVGTYLEQAGKALAGVWTVLREDETLWELLQTPLMLSIVALAYQGRSAAEVRGTGSLEQRRRHLFENYTRRMFERRTKVTDYTPEQTIHWLTWLALSLMHNNQSIFYLEWMQPDWLPSRAQRWMVAIMPIMFCGVVGGLVGGLLSELGSPLVSGLVLGLLAGTFFGLFSEELGRNRITPAEALRWSWREARSPWVAMLVSGLVSGLLAMLVFGPVYGPAYGLGGLLTGLVAGRLSTSQIAIRTIPNEGIRRSLRNALISFLTIGLGAGALFGLGTGVLFGLDTGALFGLTSGLVFGLLFGLRNGGFAYLKHHLLRILLWRNNYAPWNYIRFLDYAAERVFLRKIGGGYVFIHRILMEYFATLQPTDQARQTRTE